MFHFTNSQDEPAQFEQRQMVLTIKIQERV